MRKRSKELEAQLSSVLNLAPDILLTRIAIRDYRRQGHIASEILATIIRTGSGKHTGVLTAAADEFNRRMVQIATRKWRVVAFVPKVRRKGNRVVQDAVHYMWDNLLSDKSPLSNAETAFIVFVRDRFEEYVRHLGTTDNDMTSVEDLGVTDDDGKKTAFLSTLVDVNAATPEALLIEKQALKTIHQTLMEMPKIERDAFALRTEYEFEWRKVAELLHCSIPTATAHWQSATDKLRGALND